MFRQLRNSNEILSKIDAVVAAEYWGHIGIIPNLLIFSFLNLSSAFLIDGFPYLIAKSITIEF